MQNRKNGRYSILTLIKRSQRLVRMASRGNGEALDVETLNLHLELCAALKEDVSRKRTDDMKKRAIHTAASYDEFRHMVSCADLTPVTRKEMEMLSDQKRGWQGRSGGFVSTKNRQDRCGRRRTPTRTRTSSSTTSDRAGAKTDPLRPPKDNSQFQRDWRRRCRTDDERREYLRLIGPEKLSVLFRVEMEPDILAQLLSLVCREFSASPVEDQVLGAGGRGLFKCRTGVSDDETSLCEADAKKCLEWLWALTKTGRFEVNVMFLDNKEKLAIRDAFGVITASFGDKNNGDARRLESLRQAYAVYPHSVGHK